MESVRIDKWLWAARFYKTRSLAARACEMSRVRSGGLACKPARPVKVGEMLDVETEGGKFTIEIMGLAELRGPASVAHSLYRETDESRELRLKAAAERKAMMSYMPAPVSRPSKRDRRRIIQFRESRDRH